MLKIIRTARDPQDPYKKPYAIVTDTGTPIRAFEHRRDAFDYLEFSIRTGSLNVY